MYSLAVSVCSALSLDHFYRQRRYWPSYLENLSQSVNYPPLSPILLPPHHLPLPLLFSCLVYCLTFRPPLGYLVTSSTFVTLLLESETDQRTMTLNTQAVHINSSGPRTEPWGTPNKSSMTDDRWPLLTAFVEERSDPRQRLTTNTERLLKSLDENVVVVDAVELRWRSGVEDRAVWLHGDRRRRKCPTIARTGAVSVECRRRL